MMRWLAMTLLLTLSVPSAARERSLDAWFDAELTPWVLQQLSEHPRFRGETVMFVNLDNDRPAARSNALSVQLRDRLQNAAVAHGGIRVVTQPPTVDRDQPLDCTRGDIHYYIGLEVDAAGDGRLQLTLRALDREDSSWVAGFSKSWRGVPNRSERLRAHRAHVDPALLGARDAPFAESQTDLLAARLAWDLSCALLKQAGSSYVLTPASGDPELEATLALVRNNLAAQAAIDLAPSAEQANATLSVHALPIDGDLHQVWLSVTPSADAELEALSTSAYMRWPSAPSAALQTPEPPVVRPAPQSAPAIASSARGAGLIGTVRLTDGRLLADCVPAQHSMRTASRSTRPRCSLLEARLEDDAIVFFLEQHPGSGLVRIGDPACRRRTRAQVARAGDSLRLPVDYVPAERRDLREVDGWQIEAQAYTVYAIAAQDSRTARLLANHFDHLPRRCGTRQAHGVSGASLESWIDEFERLAATAGGRLDWRAITIRDVL